MTTRKLLANLGDSNWTEHGGFLVFDKDEYGNYTVDVVDTWRLHVGEISEESDPKMLWDVYSFDLETVSPNEDTWYKVKEAAKSYDLEESEVWDLLNSDDPVKLAGGYQVLIGYHGAIEFDCYPVTLNAIELQTRYSNLIGYSDLWAWNKAELVNSMAKTFWVLAWSDYEEEQGRSYPGQELFNMAPDTPQSAIEYAHKFYLKVENENGISLQDFTPKGLDEDDNDFHADLGHYLVMESLGHGIAWTDDRDEDHGLKLPYVENYEHDFDEKD